MTTSIKQFAYRPESGEWEKCILISENGMKSRLKQSVDLSRKRCPGLDEGLIKTVSQLRIGPNRHVSLERLD